MPDLTITWAALKTLAQEEITAVKDCDPDCAQYQVWTALSPIAEAGMERMGKLVADTGEIHDTVAIYPGSNYWSADDPMALAWYPYNYCDVFKKKDCESYYLVYTEFGGHAPERRARLVLKYLILTEDNA